MNLFRRSATPIQGLLPIEKIVLIYLFFTLVVMLFMRPSLVHFNDMLLLRGAVLLFIAGAWGIYRLHPCDATMLLRVFIHILSLIEWYPDTYEFNRCFDNLDHIFCLWEQTLFGCQPALLFSQVMPWHVLSELLDLGYASYYFLVILTGAYYFFFQREYFQRAVFIIMGAFLAYYAVFIFLPVAGPTFYYRAVGLEMIDQGIFPAIGDYFSTHSSLVADCLPTPGWREGPMWKLVEIAKATGERPTAAFPSSHVGVIVVCLLLLWKTRSWKAFYIVLPFAILMFFATVYIQAHYALDAIAGLISGVLVYLVLWQAYTLFKSKGADS